MPTIQRTFDFRIFFVGKDSHLIFVVDLQKGLRIFDDLFEIGNAYISGLNTYK